ncbi:MAG: type II secretion system protein [Akkermansiaceae bacterium]|nr:type II secretion system protein [Akkermansiaceae bacterium]NNM29668.1 type II secretion system protein [Akkermansiaceae bacterium]
MPARHQPFHRSRRGFTLVELLVTITIVITLAALIIAFTKGAFQAADSARCLERLRQSGAIMVGAAASQNNRIRIFKGGAGSFDQRPYFILRDEMNLPDESYDAHFATLSTIMFCPAAPEPKTPHWNCYGLNFTNSKVAGATWSQERIRDEQGRSAQVSSLYMTSVQDPSRFVLIADSCRSDGQQIFRISGGDRIGLRHKMRANVFFLDGSARAIDASGLGRLGFTQAYDTSTNPPTSVTLPQTSS